MITWSSRAGWFIGVEDSQLLVTRLGVDSRVAVGAQLAQSVVASLHEGTNEALLPAGARNVLRQLEAVGATCRVLVDDSGPVATLLLSRSANPSVIREPGSERGGAIASNVHLRRGKRGLVVVGGNDGHQVLLHSEYSVAACAMLMYGRKSDDEDARLCEFQSFLRLAGMYIDVGGTDQFAEWEPTDAAFHGGSRLGSDPDIYGARGKSRSDETGKARRAVGIRRVLLTPDHESEASDFDRLLNQRRTIRQHSSQPILLAELGRVLRAGIGVRQSTEDGLGERAYRSIPTAGARSGLGMIVLAQRVRGLEPAVYEYDAVEHSLVHQHELDQVSNRWLEFAARLGETRSDCIHVLALITLTYARPRAVYDAIVYSTALKEVGAAMQTMALASAELGLAFSPLGGGFSRVSGWGDSIEGLPVIGEVLIGGAGESKIDQANRD